MLSTLKIPHEMKGAEELTDFIQKTHCFPFFTWLGSFRTWPLQPKASVTPRQASGPEMRTFKIPVPAKTRTSSQVSKFQRARSEGGAWSWVQGCTHMSAEPVSYHESSLAQRKYLAAAGVETVNVETEFVLRLTTDHSDSLRSHKPRTRLGYNKRLCILPPFFVCFRTQYGSVYDVAVFQWYIFFNEAKIKVHIFHDVFLTATDCSWCKPSYGFISPDSISSELAGMCRQETTVRFWVWKTVKRDRHQATELRPVSAGQYHLQLCNLHHVHGAGGGVGGGMLGACGEGHTRTHKRQTAMMWDLPSLLPSPLWL